MSTSPFQYAIALAADKKFEDQVITTIKSVCCHHKRIHFYLFNRDYSEEWFSGINHLLSRFGSYISDIKIINNDIKEYDTTYEHISSESTFYRYFIPKYVEEDIVLYLDCDLVVDKPLHSLFNTDLKANAKREEIFAAAAIDPIALIYHRSKEFNAGVLLVNNKLWRKENITQKAINYSNAYKGILKIDDQSVLNHLFQNRWLKLAPSYNRQTGLELSLKTSGVPCKYQKIFPRKILKLFSFLTLKYIYGFEEPHIIHFNTAGKPWLGHKTEYAEKYWYYNQLKWEDIE